MIPLSDRAIYDMEKRGEFPRRIVLTSRKVAWDLAEIERWIEERKQSRDKAIRPGSTATHGLHPEQSDRLHKGAFSFLIKR